MNEKLIRSFIAGVIGGIVKDAADFIFYYLFHLTHYRYLDFAAQILYSNKPLFWWDSTFAQFIELIFCGMLGVLYYKITPDETNRNYLLKGWLYGVSIWLFLCTMGTLYKIQFFMNIPWPATNAYFITSSIYGLTVTWALRFFNKKYVKNPRA